MVIAGLLFERIGMMFILMFLGMFMFRTGKITEKGSKDMGNILIYIVIPAVVIKSCLSEYSQERLEMFFWSFVLAGASLLLSMAVCALVFKKNPIENFGTSFSNAGFMSIPLVEAVLGSEAVFYSAPLVGLMNILQWTYGVYVITKDRSAVSLKKVLLNPVLLAMAVGIIIFVLPIELPKVVTGTLDMIAAANAPLAMLCLGTYLAQTRIAEIFTDRKVYLSCLFRLIVIPLLTIALMTPFPVSVTAKLAILMGAAAPVGINVAVFAQIHGKDYPQSVKSIVLSTIFSILSMPVIIGIAGTVWSV